MFLEEEGLMQLNMSFLKDMFMSLRGKSTLHSYTQSRRGTPKKVMGKKLLIQQLKVNGIIQAHPWF